MKDHEIKSNRIDSLKKEIVARAQRLNYLKSSKLILENIGAIDHLVNILYATENINDLQELADFYKTKKVIFIVTTIFNDISFYERTLHSIWNQEDPNCPVIYLVKDASENKECFNLLQNYVSINRPLPSQFTCLYVHKTDKGMYEGLKQAFEFLCSLDTHEKSLITYINADDILTPSSNKTALSVCEQNSIHWLTGATRVIDENDNIVFECSLAHSSSDILNHFCDGRSGPFIQQEGSYWTIALYKSVRGFNISLKFAGDYDLWQQFAEKTEIYNLTKPTACFRKRRGQKSENLQAYYNELELNQDFYKYSFESPIIKKNSREGYVVDFNFPHTLEKRRKIGELSSPVFDFISDPNFCYVKDLQSFKTNKTKLAIFPSVVGDNENVQLGAPSHKVPHSLENYVWYTKISGNKIQKISYIFEKSIEKNCILSFKIIAAKCRHMSKITIRLNNITRSIDLSQDKSNLVVNKYLEIDLFFEADGQSSLIVDFEAQHVEYCLISLHNYAYSLPSDINTYGYLDSRFLGWPYLSGNLKPLYSEEFIQTLPIISVVVPTFNQGTTIRDTLTSLFAQNYPKLQVILLDGNSNDYTREILKDFVGFISELRSWDDSGQSAAIAEGIDLAKGEIITWLNTDDLYAPLSLFKVAISYVYGSKPDIIAGNCYAFRDKDFKWIHSCQIWSDQMTPTQILDVKNYWLRGKYFHQPEVFFTRSAIQKVKEKCNEDFINKKLFYSMDYDIWAKMAIASCKVKKINSVTAMYRLTEEQKTSSVDNYLPELLEHSHFLSKRFHVDLNQHEINEMQSISDWSQFKVLLFNDVGFYGGAGIAHRRIASALKLYDIDVICMSVSDVWCNEKHTININHLESRLNEIKPNLVICGNLHGIKDSQFQILEILASNCPCWFVVHDFWITNGKNPYPSLDSNNPLQNIVLPGNSWIEKINSISNLYLLSNSEYCRETINTCGFKRIINSDFHLSLENIRTESESSQLLTLNNSFTSDKISLVLGSVGLAEERKGISIFLDAIKLISPEILSKIRVRTYGFNSLNELSNLCEYIHYGFVDQETIDNILQESDIYINTSKVETFGQTTLEALNHGLICLSNINGGSSEIIIDNYNGYHFLMTPESLSDKLSDILISFINKSPSTLSCRNKLARSLSSLQFTSESQGYTILKSIVNSGLFDYPVGGQKVSTLPKNSFDIPLEIIN